MSRRVLIFDDDKDLLNICSIILRPRDYDIYTRDNCLGILDDIELYNPGVIILDYRIPGMDGGKAVQAIKKDVRFQSIPVILFSGNNDIEELAKEAGADFYLRKPFDITELENMVDQAMTSRLNEL